MFNRVRVRLAGDLRAPPKLWLFFGFVSVNFLLFIFLLKANHFGAPAGQTLARGSGRHFLVIAVLFWNRLSTSEMLLESPERKPWERLVEPS